MYDVTARNAVKNPRKMTDAQRAAVVTKYVNSGLKAADFSRKIGLHPGTLSHWCGLAIDGKLDVKPYVVAKLVARKRKANQTRGHRTVQARLQDKGAVATPPAPAPALAPSAKTPTSQENNRAAKTLVKKAESKLEAKSDHALPALPAHTALIQVGDLKILAADSTDPAWLGKLTRYLRD